jgi:predicted phosphoribosyltransferase
MLKAFRDRSEAGRLLARRLARYRGRDDVIVLALPRGGAPVAYEIAVALDAPLDVFVVRKLGVPSQPELAMGAIASGGIRVLSHEVIDDFGIEQDVIDFVAEREQRELERRERIFRSGRPSPSLKDRVVILVDDGIATGATMRAAIQAVRAQAPKRIVVAAPVAARQSLEEMSADADEIMCLLSPEPLMGIGLWYEDFAQLRDEEVVDLLKRAGRKYAESHMQ